MKNIYIRRISILGLCLIALYLGEFLTLVFGKEALWIPVPIILVWLFIYDLVTNKFTTKERSKNIHKNPNLLKNEQ